MKANDSISRSRFMPGFTIVEQNNAAIRWLRQSIDALEKHNLDLISVWPELCRAKYLVLTAKDVIEEEEK